MNQVRPSGHNQQFCIWAPRPSIGSQMVPVYQFFMCQPRVEPIGWHALCTGSYYRGGVNLAWPKNEFSGPNRAWWKRTCPIFTTQQLEPKYIMFGCMGGVRTFGPKWGYLGPTSMEPKMLTPPMHPNIQFLNSNCCIVKIGQALCDCARFGPENSFLGQAKLTPPL